METLKRFRASLVNGSELYPVSSSMLKYHFGEGSFDQFIGDFFHDGLSATTNELRKAVADIASVVFDSTRNAIAMVVAEKKIKLNIEKGKADWKLYSDRAPISTFENVVVLFAAIYNARSVDGLFEVWQLEEMDQIKAAAEKLVFSILKLNIALRFTENIWRFFGLGDHVAVVNYRYGPTNDRLYEIENSSAKTAGEKTEEEFDDEVLASCLKVLDSLDKRHYNIEEIDSASELKFKGHLEKSMMLRFCEKSWSAWDCTDMRVLGSYLQLLKCLFQCASEDDINDILRQFFSFSRDSRGELPNFKKTYRKFSLDFVKLMNGMGDPTQFQKDDGLLNRVTREFAFLFLIAPKPTLWDVVTQCVENKVVVPNVLRVLRKLDAILELKESVIVSDSPADGKTDVSLIVVALRRLLTMDISGCTDEQKRQSFVYFLVALTRERRAVIKPHPVVDALPLNGEQATSDDAQQFGDVLDEGVVSGVELLRALALPALFKRIEVSIMLELITKCLWDSGAKRTPIQWSTGVSDVNPETVGCFSSIHGPTLLAALIDIIGANNARDPSVEALCLKCVAALGTRFKDDGVVFDEQSRSCILSRLNGHKWPMKYVVLSWLSDSLGNPKRQIPSGLYMSLSKTLQENYEKITVDFEYAPVECFLRSLFELAKLAPKVAVEFIQQGITYKPTEECVRTKISQALYDSLDESMTHEKLLGLYEVLNELIIAVDSPTETVFPVATSESTFHGLRLINALLLLGETVALAKSVCDDALECYAAQRSQTSELLLVGFCQIAKNHMEREVLDLRRSRLPYPPHIREPRAIADGVNIDRFMRVGTQLVQLFGIACWLAQIYEKPPGQLRVLLLVLAEYWTEMQTMAGGPTLDAMKGHSRAGAVVYAVANTQTCTAGILEKGEVNAISVGDRAKSTEGALEKQQIAAHENSAETETAAPLSVANPMFDMDTNSKGELLASEEISKSATEAKKNANAASKECEHAAAASRAAAAENVARRDFAYSRTYRGNDSRWEPHSTRGGNYYRGTARRNYGDYGEPFRGGLSEELTTASVAHCARGFSASGAENDFRDSGGASQFTAHNDGGYHSLSSNSRPWGSQNEQKMEAGGALEAERPHEAFDQSWNIEQRKRRDSEQRMTHAAGMSKLSESFEVAYTEVLDPSNPNRQNFSSHIRASLNQISDAPTRERVENKLNQPYDSSGAAGGLHGNRNFAEPSQWNREARHGSPPSDSQRFANTGRNEAGGFKSNRDRRDKGARRQRGGRRGGRPSK